MSKKKASRVIGIDYGMARIGIAYSDESKIISTPLTTIQTEKKLADTAKKVLEQLNNHAATLQYTIETLVIGMPFMMNGKKGLIADEVMAFIDALKELTNIPIITWDERLSSVQAERMLMESTMSRKKRTQFVDKVSALIILQSWLDSEPATRSQGTVQK